MINLNTTKKDTCSVKLRTLRDALEAIQGKWKIPIIFSLSFGNKRFGEIKRDIEDISPKMLSQELKELEMNKLITRTLYDTMPISVEYALTPLGKSLNKSLDMLTEWGILLRKEVIRKD